MNAEKKSQLPHEITRDVLSIILSMGPLTFMMASCVHGGLLLAPLGVWLLCALAWRTQDIKKYINYSGHLVRGIVYFFPIFGISGFFVGLFYPSPALCAGASIFMSILSSVVGFSLRKSLEENLDTIQR